MMTRKPPRLFVFVTLFAVSVVILLFTALDLAPNNRIVDFVDVAITVSLIATGIYILAKRSRKRVKGVRKSTITILKGLLSIPLLLLILFFLNIPLKWDLLLIGLSWRFWLLSFVVEDLMRLYVRKRRVAYLTE